MLDLFAGRLGWTKAFLARGWECVAVDLVIPPEIPKGCEFIKLDVLKMAYQTFPVPHFNVATSGSNPFWEWCNFDFICASTPCEEFSCFGMKHFHPNPPYPEMGCRLFWHAHKICKLSGVPFILENVRSAQQFVGKADAHCGPFYLWGDSIPPLLPQGITKAKSAPKNSEHGRNHGAWQLRPGAESAKSRAQGQTARFRPN
jgi:hypothetical protein